MKKELRLFLRGDLAGKSLDEILASRKSRRERCRPFGQINKTELLLPAVEPYAGLWRRCKGKQVNRAFPQSKKLS